jgi:hypothetical protein
LYRVASLPDGRGVAHSPHPCTTFGQHGKNYEVKHKYLKILDRQKFPFTDIKLLNLAKIKSDLKKSLYMHGLEALKHTEASEVEHQSQILRRFQPMAKEEEVTTAVQHEISILHNC